MLLQTFITDYMQPSVSRQPDAEVAYIAQQPLFDQLPLLIREFEQPELMGGEAMQMNAGLALKGLSLLCTLTAMTTSWHKCVKRCIMPWPSI